jgi:hypothetical protein
VLYADDAVANKVCATFGRAEVRDYVDVAAILASGRYSARGSETMGNNRHVPVIRTREQAGPL